MAKARLLIVEDEAIIVRDLQRRLENQGYVITSAVATGEDAIRKAAEDKPDLVLMDIVLLGEIDGIEAARQIRARLDIPVIYVTAYADDKIIERAKVTEPYGYILKPFDDRELRSVIEMAMHKHAVEAQLREHHVFLQSVIESLTHPFYVINTDDYRVVMANSAAKFGPISERSTCFALTHHSDKPCEGEDHPCTIREVLKKGGPVLVEHVHYDGNGKARTYEICGHPIYDSDGRITRVIEYTQDVTEKRLLETQFLQAQKMESVGRLAGGIAHDFNNLLSAVLGYSELALSNLPDDHPVRKHLEVISDAGNRAASLVRQLLAFSRKQSLEMKVVNLNDIVRSLEKILQLVVGDSVILDINLSPAAMQVKADPGQVEQVLMNLAVNARDAMSCGGRLTVETANIELDEDYALRHKDVMPGIYVMLAVTDSGEGMTPEVKEKIFEPFYTTKGIKGTGLGLSTVYGIVKQHGGSIYVYSEKGMGTTFKVYLPVTGENEELKAGVTEKRADFAGKETILVVDDEPSIRSLVTDTLQPLGYMVVEASCGEEALQRSTMMKDDIHLLLTDLVMPDMSGHEVAKKIKASRPGIKIIYMSGYTDETIERLGISRHRETFLQKPLTPRKLSSAIRDALNQPIENT